MTSSLQSLAMNWDMVCHDVNNRRKDRDAIRPKPNSQYAPLRNIQEDDLEGRYKPSLDVLGKRRRNEILYIDSDEENVASHVHQKRKVVSDKENKPSGSMSNSKGGAGSLYGAAGSYARRDHGNDPATVRASTSSLQPSAKPAPPGLPYRKHDRHWNLDGSLIVRIEGVGYKLCRSRIVKESEWFAAILAHQEEVSRNVLRHERAENGDSIPIITLDEVVGSVMDWERLVDALDDAITYLHAPPSHDHLYSVLRVSHALGFRSFEAWAKRVVIESWSSGPTGTRHPCGVNAATALALGRQFEMPALVERVMYQLMKENEFGLTLGDTDDEDRKPRMGGAEAADLSREDRGQLAGVQSWLRERWMEETSRIPMDFLPCEGPPKLASGKRCVGKRAMAAHDVFRRVVVDTEFRREWRNDVVGGFEALGKIRWKAEGGFCMHCVDRLKEMWQEKGEAVWENCVNLLRIQK
ncbi:hypothetical protein DFP72DRAFT_911378 [Ephemerocybe angulata]|uniref:BTB domain-containing protein n=1 Tax=Ephemerocybe angulata TaxID=980116 RepID=A0A8H6HND6_9AGAR|nr:hypothetical protein DFP72DRAFT_911378 [Tulosesus angulatus]